MFSLNNSALRIFVVAFFLLAASFAFLRDLQWSRQYQDDFRNRLVGARLMKDGRSPYFYKWKKADGLRYYDPQSFDGYKVSNITASPFFHHLFFFLADLPQAKAAQWWFITQYAMFGIIVFIALGMAEAERPKIIVIAIATVFLFTAGWKDLIYEGQNYLCIPFLAMVFYCCIIKKNGWLWPLAAGSVTAALMLIRPNTILFFLPFLLLVKNYGRKKSLLVMMPVLLAFAWVIFSKQERFFWSQYGSGIAQQIRVHQHNAAATQVNDADPYFMTWEGVNRKAANELHAPSENGNLFIVWKMLFHTRVPVWLNNGLFFLIASLITGIFWWEHKKRDESEPYHVALLGFCLYMLSDFFSLILRWQYNAVQWLFPLLLAGLYYNRSFKAIHALIAVGLLLNLPPDIYVALTYSTGEYCMLVGFAVLSIYNTGKTGSAAA